MTSLSCTRVACVDTSVSLLHRQRRDLAVGFAVHAGLGAGRDRLEEFGARRAASIDIVGKRWQRLQFRQPGAQLLDVVVAAQSGQGRGELVAGALQFAATLIGLPRRGQIGDLCRCQRGSQLLLRRSVLRLNVERGHARRDAGGHDAGNLDLGRGIRRRSTSSRRPAATPADRR